MSASGEELDFFYLNSVNSQLSLFPSYKIEEETQGPSADLLTSDGPLLFYKINPFLPLPLGFWTIILKTRTHVQWYTLSFIILIAATSSNANCRHFFCVQSRNIEWSYVDCGEIGTVGSGTDVTISISPHCCFTQTWTEMVSFLVEFSTIKNQFSLRKSKIYPH